MLGGWRYSGLRARGMDSGCLADVASGVGERESGLLRKEVRWRRRLSEAPSLALRHQSI